MTAPSLSAVVITRNEEKNIRECLECLRFCQEIVVVDSGSGDRTVQIARECGAKVFENSFKDYASQKNFGIGKASGDWILSIDADERVSPALAGEIQALLAAGKADGYYLPRRNNLLGRWMKYGDNAGDYQLRLAKKPLAHFQGAVHEKITPSGRLLKTKHELQHYSTRTISDYMAKLNAYTTLEARRPVSGGIGLRPLAVFFRQGLWRRGWLDGLEGFLWSVLSAYYEFVRQAKQWERINEKKEA